MAAHRLRRPGQHPFGADSVGAVEGLAVGVDCRVKLCYSGWVDS